MKKQTPLLCALLALGLCSAPLLASPLDGKKEPPKQEKKKDSADSPDKHPAPSGPRPIAIGTEIDAATSLSDCAGNAHTIKQYRGRVLVLVMWSTTNAKSVQMQRLAKLAANYASKNVAVLGLDPVPGESKDAKAIAEALKKSGAPFSVLLDDGAILAERLGASALDEVFVLDGKGAVRYTGAVDDDPKGEKAEKAQAYLAAALDELLAGKEVANQNTPPNGGALRLPKRKPAPHSTPKR
ncbi:MAG: TlpA family protein disulfide reductase [Planctomycetes bacterium]|nr:TlpA family protein disulfide reductase [Planctomycetota bacterium]